MNPSSTTVKYALGALAAAFALMAGGNVLAEQWSDTWIAYRYGTKFAEPYNTQDITKNIISLSHVGGYKYGSNFFNADLLMSDNKDPSTVGGSGAQEADVVYRNTVDLSKVTGKQYTYGIVRDVGVTFGFEWNTKNDVGYGSKKRMLVLGPTVMIDVPGFLNVSLLALDESNAPVGHPQRYHYQTHPMLAAAWGIPFGASPFSFEGFVLFIASKGKNEFGAQTAPETNFDGALMLDLGSVMGGPKSTFKAGFEYQWWKNKYGNDASGPAGPGAFAKTPMIRVEYHF
jgi:hypothetical protein